jgi:hypothetical protein
LWQQSIGDLLGWRGAQLIKSNAQQQAAMAHWRVDVAVKSLTGVCAWGQLTKLKPLLAAITSTQPNTKAARGRGGVEETVCIAHLQLQVPWTLEDLGHI